MEFWGVEVKAGEPLKVELNEGRALHLSQACLGEIKKDKAHESICLYVNVNGKKLVLGTLFSEKLPQQMFDLVFDKEFELSHNWKNGSVFFYGYTADNAPGDEEEYSDSESEEDIPLLVPNGAPATEVKQEKPAEVQNSKAGKESAAAGKQKVKIVEPDEKSEDEDDSSDEDDLMSEDDSEDDADNKSVSDEDEDDDSDEEETPVQPVEKIKTGKKRASESASKTSVPDKKAKLVTPQKTDGKKSGVVHVATPHPSKQTGKTPANKPNQQTPKGSHSCKPCNRTFKSEMALDSHNKAKHGG